MNIAFITPEYITEKGFDGGLSNYIHKISLGLTERGHNIFVIVSSDKNEQFVSDGITIIRVKISRNFVKIKIPGPFSLIIQSWQLNKTVNKLNKNINFDIIQFASYTAVGLFASKHIKTISRISSYQPLWDKAYGIEASLSSKINSMLELYALQRTNEIYGPSQVIADVINKKLNKPVEIIESPLPSKIKGNSIIYNDAIKNKKYLLFFGSIGVLKGIKEIGEIIFELLKNNTDLYFVFIGKDMGYNGKPMINYIWDMAEENRGRCLYLGSLRQTYLQVIIKNAFAVVLPSRIDNLPNTCTESMALGKIVIGTRGASFDQLIEDTQNGYLCEIADSNSLLSAIEKVLSLLPEQKKLIEANAKKTVTRLEMSAIAEKTEHLFKNVIGKQ